MLSLHPPSTAAPASLPPLSLFSYSSPLLLLARSGTSKAAQRGRKHTPAPTLAPIPLPIPGRIPSTFTTFTAFTALVILTGGTAQSGGRSFENRQGARSLRVPRKTASELAKVVRKWCL